jgi:hypothetical protein
MGGNYRVGNQRRLRFSKASKLLEDCQITTPSKEGTRQFDFCSFSGLRSSKGEVETAAETGQMVPLSGTASLIGDQTLSDLSCT